MLDIQTFVWNIGAALLMGMAIGFERQYRQHPAGLRTSALVCVGSALFVSLSRMMDHEASPTRIAAQVVSGVGFLAGGVILREGFSVRGMNTAATLWCTAAVGTLAGAGFVMQATIGTVAVLLVHLSLRPVVRAIDSRSKTALDVETVYRMHVVCESQHEGIIRTIFLRHINAQPTMTVQGISTHDMEPPNDKSKVVAEIFSSVRNDKFMNDLVSRMSVESSVSGVSWERIG
jgi:putative Mg2+ transporter-C (MgtC) family protein